MDCLFLSLYPDWSDSWTSVKRNFTFFRADWDIGVWHAFLIHTLADFFYAYTVHFPVNNEAATTILPHCLFFIYGNPMDIQMRAQHRQKLLLSSISTRRFSHPRLSPNHSNTRQCKTAALSRIILLVFFLRCNNAFGHSHGRRVMQLKHNLLLTSFVAVSPYRKLKCQ